MEDETKYLSQEIFDSLPLDGTTIGNKTLREQLEVTPEDYLTARKLLLDEGRISLGRGKGGSLRRAVDLHGEADAKPSGSANADIYEKETSLYGPLLLTIKGRWVPDFNPTNWLVQNTAHGGRRKDGTWSRPDISVIARSTYSLLPGAHLDVITFEVKHYNRVDLTAVYEAMAHRRSATRSFVLLYVPDAEADRMSATLDEIEEEAARHGIGFLIFADPNDYDTWTLRADAVRTEPDPARMNDFLSDQFTQNAQNELRRWFR